ncbi:MAG TPA: amidase family protein, partial [Cryomorphaceae bacterium]|nr:amidase family protein [Cryomorphaceae bacterium]
MKNYSSLSEIQKALANGESTLPQIVEEYIRTIDETKSLNIFLEIFSEESLKRADEIQEKISLGTSGLLAGAVIAIKDNLCYAGHKVGAASQILEGFESLYTATAVERLVKEDAIIIGRVNCDEFAMGGSNENSAYGPVLNPLNREYVPGGSSGGSAAAVAANCCLVALGSDTGGSIRQPASFCGVVGVKPTYGRVSRHGLIAFASSFDQIGPLANNVGDAAKVLEVISGKDDMDTTSSSVPVDFYDLSSETEKRTSAKKKIGYIDECFTSEAIDPDVKKKHLALIEKLKAEGHVVEAVHLEELKYLVPAYYVLTTAEASS